MFIRPFAPCDADVLASLFHASVREAGIRHYSADQVVAWSPSKPDPEGYVLQAESRTMLVAVDDDNQPIGYGDLNSDGSIGHLYCHPDLIGTGVGSAIYAAIESAVKRADLSVLYVETSEGARRLFKRRGFHVLARMTSQSMAWQFTIIACQKR